MVGDTALGVAEIADDELVERIRRGDGDAFRTLVARHRSWLIARCRRHLGGDAHAAEDVAQECFVALQRTLGRSDRPMHVRPWLSVVARNRCIDETRKARATPTPIVPDSAVYDPEVGTEDPHLAKAWSALNGRHRTVLELREVGGLSYDEIAVTLAVTSGAVETLLFRARTALRREYARAGGKVASMAPMQEAVARASGGKGVLSRLAEGAASRLGDGGAAAAQTLANGSANATGAMGAGSAAADQAASVASSSASSGWLLDLQTRLLSSGALDPVVQQATGGRLRMVLAGLGVLLGTVAVTAPTLAPSTPPPASSPSAPEPTVPPTSAPAPAAPSTADATGGTTAPAPPDADAPAATPPDAGTTTPPAPTTPTVAVPAPVAAPVAGAATTATTAVTAVDGATGAVVDGVAPATDPVLETVDSVLGLRRR